MRNTLAEQVWVGLLLGTGLSVGGWLRVYATNGSIINASAIALSLWLIVMTSVLLGTALPFALTRVSAAHELTAGGQGPLVQA
jgi:Mg/Co/Ni transporter MgtE